LAKLYLDSSTIVKRYVEEKGTDSANLVYSKCDAKELSVVFSMWNIGEVLGAIDQYRQRSWLTQQQYNQAVRNLAGESLRLISMDALEIVPVSSSALTESWSLVEKYHMYQADALQIVTCRHSEADILLTADRSLAEVATKEGASAINVENFDAVNSELSGTEDTTR